MQLNDRQLTAYFARIGIDRPARADLAALAAIHRAHARAFAWEALDAFMGWPTSLDPHVAFAKLVEGRRGGWCYEMNGLLGAALAGCGFAVTRLCSAVRRADLGDGVIGNHLTLRVDLDGRPWLVEAGLGDAVPLPVPLAIGAHEDEGFAFGIGDSGDGWLRYRNHAHGFAPGFDFRAEYADEEQLAAKQAWLTGDPGSPFTGMLVVARQFPGRIESIHNRTRRSVTAAGVTERAIPDAEAFAVELRGFGLAVPDAYAVWERAGAIAVAA